MRWIKVANIAQNYFVIRITITTFVHSEKLVFWLQGFKTTSDPEEDLKVKSLS